MPKKLHLPDVPKRLGTAYPPPYDVPCRERVRHKLGDAAGLTQFGVNLLRLVPGAWSSQRHWHTHEDEFVYVLDGEVVLITGEGEETLGAGDCAGFKGGVPDGHHLVNRGQRDALVLEVGTRHPGGDTAEYPDIDLRAEPPGAYVHKDGTPYGTGPRTR
jgi:uncharacterized cupin superfamily protein